ncbi:oligosaccharide flippase family protein [[Eubacterium] hominis]|uniref:oligosaccharide flippase family protein n=1 Tax=[Eubacterium] hominis TaxID=2764325 RepID=UPI003A4DEB35
MKEKYKYLSKNVLLFSISGFVPKILSFLLVPLYTGILTTKEYGISDLISTTVMLLLPIFTCDIQDAVMRFAMDKKYSKKDTFTVGMQILLFGGIIVALGAFIIYKLKLINGLYLLFATIMFITTAIYNSSSLFCRAIDKVKVITYASIINSFVTLIANIVLLAVIPLGLTGYLIANSLGSFIALIYIFYKANLIQYLRTRINKKLRKEMLLYSFPLIFSVIAWWINNASDRYILTWMSGIAISGVYAVSYKIPNLLSMFQNIFAQAWSISAIKEFDKNDKDGFIGNTYTLMNFAMVAGCSFIMLINIPLAKILYSNEFYVAWKFVPPLLIAVVFNAMALFIGSVFTAVKDTKTLSYTTVIGGLINTICNFILIYFFNAYGAAIATLIGYGATLILRRVILRKYICIRVNNKRDILCYMILVAQMAIASLGWISIILQACLFICIVILYKTEFKKIILLFIKK